MQPADITQEEEPLMSSSVKSSPPPQKPAKKEKGSPWVQQLKFTLVALLIGLCLAIHALPIEGSFFAKAGALRRFVRGDLTKEVDLEKQENTKLKKELSDVQVTTRSLRSASSAEEDEKQKLQDDLAHSSAANEASQSSVARWKQQTEDMQASIANLEKSLAVAEQKNAELRRTNQALTKRSSQADQVQAELERSRLREQAEKEKLHQLKKAELNLLRGSQDF